MKTRLITLVATIAVVLLSFGASAAGAAPGCAQSAGCQPIGERPSSPALRAAFWLVRLDSTSACGTEGFAIVVNERRKAILC